MLPHEWSDLTETGCGRYSSSYNGLAWWTTLIADMTQAPEIQTMYSLTMPVSAIRTKMRQEFERHRFVAQLKTVDVLLMNSHQEFQVRHMHNISAALESGIW